MNADHSSQREEDRWGEKSEKNRRLTVFGLGDFGERRLETRASKIRLMLRGSVQMKDTGHLAVSSVVV